MDSLTKRQARPKAKSSSTAFWRRKVRWFFLLAWIFAVGYFVGYVHHGLHDGAHPDLVSSSLHHPLRAAVQSSSSPSSMPSVSSTGLSSSSSTQTSSSASASLVSSSSPSASTPTTSPAQRSHAIPIAKACSSVEAMNATEELAARHQLAHNRIEAGLSAADDDHMKALSTLTGVALGWRRTHRRLLLPRQLFDRLNLTDAHNYFASHKPPQTGFDGISYASLSKVLSVTQDPHVYTMSCTYFDLFCMHYLRFVPRPRGKNLIGQRAAEMTDTAIGSAYNLLHIPPVFYPNVTEVGRRIVHNNNFAKQMGNAMISADWAVLSKAQSGANLNVPEVGIIYNGWVTRHGSILSPGILIEAWPDQAGSKWPIFVDQVLGTDANGTLNQKWRDVERVLVLTHVHQDMFWHWMVSEMYRMLPLYHYMLAHPDIYIHINGGDYFIPKYVEMLGIDRKRFISWEYVRARVIYYVQAIDRSDVPPVGLTGLIQHNLLDFGGVPLDARRSILTPANVVHGSPEDAAARAATIKPYHDTDQLPPIDEEKADQILTTLPEVVIRIVFISRDNPYVGRMINNFDEVMSAFFKLAVRYRLEALSRGRNVRIEIMEHHPKLPMAETWRMFGRADIVFGPHGAGFANLFAVRPGAHVIELVHTRHLNMITTARLGLAYHAVVANSTLEGVASTAKSPNYVVDVPFLIGLVTSVLDARFGSPATTPSVSSPLPPPHNTSPGSGP